MSKTNTGRIHELEERIEVMDSVLEDYQEKMKMMTEMMSMMRQHMELMNTNLVRITTEAIQHANNKTNPTPPPSVQPSVMEEEPVQKPLLNEAHEEKENTTQHQLMRRVL